MSKRDLLLLGVVIFIATLLANLVAAGLVASEAQARLAASPSSGLLDAIASVIR